MIYLFAVAVAGLVVGLWYQAGLCFELFAEPDHDPIDPREGYPGYDLLEDFPAEEPEEGSTE